MELVAGPGSVSGGWWWWWWFGWGAFEEWLHCVAMTRFFRYLCLYIFLVHWISVIFKMVNCCRVWVRVWFLFKGGEEKKRGELLNESLCPALSLPIFPIQVLVGGRSFSFRNSIFGLLFSFLFLLFAMCTHWLASKFKCLMKNCSNYKFPYRWQKREISCNIQ